jgi:hypothetical protein
VFIFHFQENLKKIKDLKLRALKQFTHQEPAAPIQQNNKRLKRIRDLSEEPESEKSSPETIDIADATHLTSRNQSKSEEEDKENDGDQDSAVELGSLRPVRTARLKAAGNLVRK